MADIKYTLTQNDTDISITIKGSTWVSDFNKDDSKITEAIMEDIFRNWELNWEEENTFTK